MTKRSKKEVITQVVYDSLPDKSIYRGLSTENISFRWFVTGRTGKGLRLTDEGFKCFTEADIAHYDFLIKLSSFEHSDKLAMLLNKHITCPYYLAWGRKNRESNKENRGPFIRLYDSKIAMMVTLYGNIEEYLDSFNR